MCPSIPIYSLYLINAEEIKAVNGIARIMPRLEDRPLIFRIKRGIYRMNRQEDIGSLRTRKALEEMLRSYL